MRAVVCPRWGGPEALHVADMPPPGPPGEGMVRVKVAAAGVNFADLLMIAGKYQENPTLPFIPGFEVAGVVDAVSPGERILRVGERVMGMLPFGGYAEAALLRSEQTFAIPPSMGFATAAGFPVVFGTAYCALVWRARLRPGETLLVFGAAGGVGLATTAIGRALGAEVIAVAGSPERLAVAQRQGATHLIDHRREDVADRVLGITGGRGVNVVVDPVGGTAFDAALRAIASGGRLVVVGFASGTVGQLSMGVALGKNIDVMGCYWGGYRDISPDLIRRVYDELGRLFEAGRIRPEPVTEMPLAAFHDALSSLAARAATGKLVLVPGD